MKTVEPIPTLKITRISCFETFCPRAMQRDSRWLEIDKYQKTKDTSDYLFADF